MKPTIVNCNKPNVLVRETSDSFEFTINNEITESRNYGIHIPWGVIILFLIILIVVALWVFLSASHSPVKQTTMEDSEDSHLSAISNLTERFKASGIVFSNSDTVKLTQEDFDNLRYIEGYSYGEMLRFAINEIYARRGYSFQTEKFVQFYHRYGFDGHLSAEETTTHFNDVEWYNLDLLLKAERKLK